MAIQQRKPAPGLIVHSDRGSQYASALYQDLLGEHGFICSMSRKGNCWDNAVAERFFLNLKMERVWQRQYANHAEAKADITDYIVGFYNCKRINSALDKLSPAVYKRKMAEREPIVVSEIDHHKGPVRCMFAPSSGYQCFFGRELRTGKSIAGGICSNTVPAYGHPKFILRPGAPPWLTT
jgi:hypothetical protein